MELTDLHSRVDMNEICSKYSGRLFQAAYGITKDYHKAEDVVQDTFVKAYKKMDTIQDVDKMGPWLARIATRTAIDYIRKEKRNNEVFFENTILDESHNSTLQSTRNVEKEVELTFLQEEVLRFIEGLSIDKRNVFLLKMNGLQEKEIAQQLDLKQGTVKTNFYRVRKQLKTILG